MRQQPLLVSVQDAGFEVVVAAAHIQRGRAAFDHDPLHVLGRDLFADGHGALGRGQVVRATRVLLGRQCFGVPLDADIPRQLLKSIDSDTVAR